MENDWTDSSEFPDVLSQDKNGFSIDVLIYCKKTDEHTIGWFNFNKMTWNFLCRESVGKFKWRYLDKEVDRPK